MRANITTLRKSRGTVLIFAALSMLVILGMAGLALDSADSYSNLTRLQTAVDSAAIAAGQKLLLDMQNNVGSSVLTTAANQAGRAAYQANLNEYNSHWLGASSSADVEFCWSKNLQNFGDCEDSFTSPSDTQFFVRATVPSTPLNNFLIQVLGVGATRSVGTVAVAGLSGTIFDCRVAPFFVCDNTPEGETTDTNCEDGFCFGQPVTRRSDMTVDSTHFFGIKVGADNPPTTPVAPETHATCTADGVFDGLTGPASQEKDNCLLVRDQRPTDNTTTTPYCDDTQADGCPISIERNTADWSFNDDITLNGNFGYLDLVNVNNDAGDHGAQQLRIDLLSNNACIQNGTTDATGDPVEIDKTQTGNISSIDAAFNALFGEAKPPFSTPNAGNPMYPNPIINYADYVAKPGHATWPIWQPISFNFYSRIYDANPAWKTSNSTRYRQRMRIIPVVDCPNPMNGSMTNPTINGYACFFFSRKMYANSDKGKLSNNESWIIAEHINNKDPLCPKVTGVGQGAPTSIFKAYIVLYQSVDSPKS
jgi:hypothetical protein